MTPLNMSEPIDTKKDSIRSKVARFVLAVLGCIGLMLLWLWTAPWGLPVDWRIVAQVVFSGAGLSWLCWFWMGLWLDERDKVWSPEEKKP